MAWQPQAQGLQEILELLRNSTESQNNALHRHVNTVRSSFPVCWFSADLFFFWDMWGRGCNRDWRS